MPNYDRQLCESLATVISETALREFLNVVDHSARAEEWSDILDRSDWSDPVYKRHPFFLSETIEPGERKLFVSPISDENEPTTREESDYTLKICLTHIFFLPPSAESDSPEPDADQLEIEIAIDELILIYLATSPSLATIGEVMRVERPQIYDFTRAQDEDIFHSTIMITLRIEM
jgi:hypothetical protein